MVRARKRFGQNFLVDEAVIDRIVAAVNPHPDDRVFEIGPGHGALTEPLAAELARLHAVELDRDLIDGLTARFANLELVSADVLQLDFRQRFAGGGWRVVGNLPYNLSSPLLLKIGEVPDLVRDVHVMLQREMAARLAAQPGSKAWGRLSVALQLGWRVETLLDVPPDAFDPPPRVWSRVVRLVPLERPPAVTDRSLFDRVVAAAFNQRRKTLANSLREFAPDFAACGLAPGVRPESVTLDDFVALANQIAARG
ncbi:MAG: 16S rRNA (adenine(1518)-N(6)/adenine(1519)-N(6))-dimethyltransferase RsmA [Pseudomonadota bacterium]